MSESRFSNGKQKEMDEKQQLRCADPLHPQLEAFHALSYLTLKKSPIGTAISFTIEWKRLREGFIEATSPTLHAPPPPILGAFSIQFLPILDLNPALHQPLDLRTDFLKPFWKNSWKKVVPLKGQYNVLVENMDPAQTV